SLFSMRASPYRTLVIIALLLALVFAGTAGVVARVLDGEVPSAGVAISNFAEATYTDESGTSFATVSPTVTVTVLAVSTLTVTPDETHPSANVGPNHTCTRASRLCNTANTPDRYTITRDDVHAPAHTTNPHFDTPASSAIT